MNTRPLVLCLAVMTLGSCAKKTSSQLTHDPGQFQHTNASWQWFEETDAEFRTFFNRTPGGSRKTILPIDDPLSLRANQWVEAIDHMMRTAQGTDMHQPMPDALVGNSAAPRPTVRIIVGPPNGFVHTSPSCFPIRVMRETLPGAPEIDAMELFPAENKWVAYPKYDATCFPRSLDDPGLASAIQWFAEHVPGCRLIREPSATLRLEGTCPTDGPIGNAKQLILTRTSNIIALNSGLFATESEEGFLFVAAHESAHFHRAHGLWRHSPFYGFFYAMPDSPIPTAPQPDPQVAALGARVPLASHHYLSTWERESFGNRFSLLLAIPDMSSVVELLATREAKDGETPCAAAAAWIKQPAIHTIFMREIVKPRTTPLTEEGRQTYTEWERQFLRCAKSASILTEGSRGLGLTPAEIIKRVPLKRFLQPSEMPPTLHTESPATLVEVFDEATRWIAALSQDARTTLEEAAAAHLGLFTVEQEADEIAAEVVYRLGISPEVGIDVNIHTLERKTSLFTPRELDAEECQTLRAHDWKDPQGRDVFVPVAEFDEDHHSSCFRAFNIARELRAHEERFPGKPPFVSHLLPQWEDLKKEATRF